MHLVRSGTLDLVHPGRPTLHVEVPSLLLYPRPTARRFLTDALQGADLVCADLAFDGGAANPMVAALPDVVCLPLARIDGIDQVLTLLFGEAFGNNCGRHEVVDRLFEVVLIQLLRHLMEAGQIGGGMLAGLSHPKLRKSLVAMHEHPGAGVDSRQSGRGIGHVAQCVCRHFSQCCWLYARQLPARLAGAFGAAGIARGETT